MDSSLTNMLPGDYCTVPKYVPAFFNVPSISSTEMTAGS
jgi:hypothetical protein